MLQKAYVQSEKRTREPDSFQFEEKKLLVGLLIFQFSCLATRVIHNKNVKENCSVCRTQRRL